jgi:hypothetical protein
MRITIEIEEKKLRSILKYTGQRKKSPAVATALDEYLDQKKRQAFVAKVMEGGTDYRASNDEVETLAGLERS